METACHTCRISFKSMCMLVCLWLHLSIMRNLVKVHSTRFWPLEQRIREQYSVCYMLALHKSVVMKPRQIKFAITHYEIHYSTWINNLISSCDFKGEKISTLAYNACKTVMHVKGMWYVVAVTVLKSIYFSHPHEDRGNFWGSGFKNLRLQCTDFVNRMSNHFGVGGGLDL